jgi:methyl-accepting chemotaxis protein
MGGGFGIVLVLMLVIAVVGARGISGVATRVEKVEGASFFVESISQCRFHVMNYASFQKQEDLDKVHELLRGVKEKAGNFKQTLHDIKNKKQIDDIIRGGADYAKELQVFAEAVKEKPANIKAMAEFAEDAMSMAEEISREFPETGSAKLVEAVLRIRLDAVYYAQKGEERIFKATDNALAHILIKARGIQTQSGNLKLKDEMASFIKNLEQYKRALGEFKNIAAKASKAMVLMKENVAAAENAAIHIEEDQNRKIGTTVSISYKILTIVSGLAVVVGILAAWLITASLTGALNKSVDLARKVADGDLSVTSDLADQKDEMGALGKAINQMTGQLNIMFKDIVGGVSTLSAASTELSAISSQMTAGVEDVSGKSLQMAGATEEMSTNMGSVASAAEQASSSMNIISSGTEEMTVNINEIAEDTVKADSISKEAVTIAESATKAVKELGLAVMDIGKVTETITKISGQTNLLALNATIEAARAGEAGKGFAVVAVEIKELAMQTAGATSEIAQKITGIQDTTDGTIQQIDRISTVIGQVSEIVASISSVMEEQAVSAREIADNVSQASMGIGEISENVSQTSNGASEVASDIAGVNRAVSDMSSASSQVFSSASELSVLAEQLGAKVNQFKLSKDA